MSWMSEEWKGQIPPEAISYIKELEGKFETTLKECKDYQLNLGTSENELEKCKQKCDRTLSDNNTLEREVNKLNAELEQLVEKLKGFQTASTNKDNVIFGLQAEIEKSRQELADLKSTNDKILCRTEQLESDQCKSDDKKNNDIEKLKEMKLLNEQRLQELQQQLDASSRDKHELVKSYEEKTTHLVSEIDSLNETNQTLRAQVAAHQVSIQNIEKQTRLETEKNGQVREEQEKIIEDLKKQIDEHECDIGNYLGINVGKICSETSLRDTKEAELECQSLKEENKTLKESLLRQQQQQQQQQHQRQQQQQQQQQHFMGTSDSSPDTGTAGLLLSIEAQEKLREENTRMREIYEDHMRVCVNTARLARKSSSATLSSNHLYEIEELKAKVQKTRQTNDELQRALTEKSNECFTLYEEIGRLKHSAARDNLDGNSLSQHAVDRLEDLVDVILQKKTSFEKEHESLNTKNNNNNNNNDRIVSQHLIQDRESLREIVSSTLDSLNIDASADHEATRRTVQESTDKILTAISQNINNNNNVLLRSKRGSNNNNSRNGERRKPQQEHEYANPDLSSFNTAAPTTCLGEVDLIRDRLDHLQQTICGRETNLRATEKERDRVRQELVAVVELMKKKDEELGRISCLYELERQKVEDNASAYRAEMEALKVEQLEIYNEFRDMCDSLKKKDIELLNKNKQTKLLSAEWRQKEDTLHEQLLQSEKEAGEQRAAREETATELRTQIKENDMLVSRLMRAEEQLRVLHDSLSRVEEMLFKAKGDGLYH